MMAPSLPFDANDIRTVCEVWLSEFANVLLKGNAARLTALFQSDAHWRDILAFTWHLTIVTGSEKFARTICDAQHTTCAANFKFDATRTPPRLVTRAGVECLEAILQFETALARGEGIFRLVPGKEGPIGWTFHTTLQELKGFEEKTGWNRPKGDSYARHQDRRTEKPHWQ